MLITNVGIPPALTMQLFLIDDTLLVRCCLFCVTYQKGGYAYLLVSSDLASGSTDILRVRIISKVILQAPMLPAVLGVAACALAF